MKTGLTALLALAMTLSMTQRVAAQGGEEPLVDQVKKSIADGIRYLRSIEKDGSWEHTAAISQVRPGGVTALAVVALLNAGVRPDDKIIERALKELRKYPPEQTYTVGLQTMAYCLAGDPGDRERIQRNLDWLNKTRMETGWGYDERHRSADHSINQYAFLGINEARIAGFKIDEKMLQEMRDYYIRSSTNGTWSYRTLRNPTLTMTTAGLCNLLITGMELSVGKAKLNEQGVAQDCGIYAEEKTVQQALQWIGAAYPARINPRSPFPHPFYCLYGIERAGRLTGRRFFGGHDWYRVGCEYLIEVQKKDGSWTGNGGFDHWPSVGTSFALLFLSKGRTPVLVSKLAHGPMPVALRQGQPEAWNNKRSDMKNVAQFASVHLYDRHPLAWQVFDIRDKHDQKAEKLAEELLQSPVLFLNGHTLDLSGNEKDMLREYVANGGFIMAEACCGDARFAKEFRDAVRDIVPGGKLAPLDKNHPIWTASGKFEVDPEKYDYGLEGVQMGCKTVLVFFRRPISGWWENNDYTTEKGKNAFHMVANVIAYATGMELPKPRLTRFHIVGKDISKTAPRGYFQVAQLVHKADAQVLAPKAMQNLMAEVRRLQLEVALTTQKVVLTSPPTDPSKPNKNESNLLNFKFFYMHDRNGFAVPPREALQDLRFTLETGGLLFADAACGSKAFDKSFREMIQTMWPEKKLEGIEIKENQKENELFSKEVNGFKIGTVKYRVEGKDGKPSKDFVEGPPRLEGIKINGRWVVVYSKYDIGCALEKHQNTNCLSHDYDSAVVLGRAVVLYSLRR